MRFAVLFAGAGCCLLIGIVIGRWGLPFAHFTFAHEIPSPSRAIPPDQANFRRARLAYFRELKGTSEVVAFGDSTIELADWAELFPRWNIANRGIRWDTTADLLARQSDVIAMRPKIVIMMAGMNDLLVGRPVPDVARRIAIVSNRFINSGIVPVVILTLKVSRHFWLNINPKVETLDLLERQWCYSHNILFIDLNPILAPNGSLDSSLTFDGLHLTDLGYLRTQSEINFILNRAMDSRMVRMRTK